MGVVLLATAAGLATAADRPQVIEGSANPQGTRHLMTMEEVYKGIVEAERRRIELAEPERNMPKSMIDEWGVQIISVSRTAKGAFLNFRFRVIDPKKASVLFDSKVQPYVESEVDGAKSTVPSANNVGYLRTTNRGHNIHAGKVYSIMFSNPGMHVKGGDKVTVVAGDFKAEHITVRDLGAARFVRR
jgi:hypothetical protein